MLSYIFAFVYVLNLCFDTSDYTSFFSVNALNIRNHYSLYKCARDWLSFTVTIFVKCCDENSGIPCKMMDVLVKYNNNFNYVEISEQFTVLDIANASKINLAFRFD